MMLVTLEFEFHVDAIYYFVELQFHRYTKWKLFDTE